MTKEKMLILLEKHFDNCVEQHWITKSKRFNLMTEMRLSPIDVVRQKCFTCGINTCTQEVSR